MFLYRKQMTDLEKRYEHSHALFISHIHGVIDRLATIANRNILYGSIHEEHALRYDKIRNEFEGPVVSALKILRDLADKKNNKGFSSIFGPTKAAVANYEKAVATLKADLEKIMNPEEETRGLTYTLKEDIRRLKDEHRNHQQELTLIEKSFERLFANIDASLAKLDEHIEIAGYVEASALISKLRRLHHQVAEIIKQAPTLCVQIERVIPDKIANLREETDRMTKKQYPVHHLMINVTVDKIEDDLKALAVQMSNLDVAGISERLRAHTEKIESYYNLFEIEKEAKQHFERDYEKTYGLVTEIEKRFIKLNASLPQIRQYYVIGAESEGRIEKLRQLISTLNMTRRALDTLVLVPTKQPYSLQVAKITSLQDDSTTAARMIEDFAKYLGSLKEQSEEAFHLVNVYYQKLKGAEHKLAELDIESVLTAVTSEFEKHYASLATIAATLQVLPIDIATIEAHVTSLKTEAEALFQRIDQETNLAALAETAIVHANRDRPRLTDYHRLLTMSEAAFQEGEFQKAYLEAGNLLKKIATQLDRK